MAAYGFEAAYWQMIWVSVNPAGDHAAGGMNAAAQRFFVTGRLPVFADWQSEIEKFSKTLTSIIISGSSGMSERHNRS